MILYKLWVYSLSHYQYFCICIEGGVNDTCTALNDLLLSRLETFFNLSPGAGTYGLDRARQALYHWVTPQPLPFLEGYINMSAYLELEVNWRISNSSIHEIFYVQKYFKIHKDKLPKLPVQSWKKKSSNITINCNWQWVIASGMPAMKTA